MRGDPSGTGPRLVAIASGKGGTGKSLVAANLGIFLATLGKRVVLVDGAFGAANLHSFAGVAEPRRSLGEALARRLELSEVAQPTLVSGLELVPGEADAAGASDPSPEELAHLRAQLGRIDADYVVLDLPGGSSTTVLDLFLAADLGLVVLTPEPTAVELAYRFLRAAFLRFIGPTVVADLGLVDPARSEGGIPGPLDLFERAREREGGNLAEELRREMSALRPYLVLNQVRSKADMDLGVAIARASRRRLGLPIRYLGHIEYDDAVWVSLRRRRPLLTEHPEARASKCVEKVTRRLLARESEVISPDRIGATESHYQLLDMEPTASEEDLRRAYRRVRQIYSRDSIVVSGLYGLGRLETMHRQIDEAYAILMDPGRRKAYDQVLFPDGIPQRHTVDSVVERLPVIEHEATPVGERPPRPELGPGTEFTGALLQKVRESLGLDLREISERTKIGMGYLTAIEEESFFRLPAPVYVRGFLVEVAKMLGIDGARVLETYYQRYRRALAEHSGDAT